MLNSPHLSKNDFFKNVMPFDFER